MATINPRPISFQHFIQSPLTYCHPKMQYAILMVESNIKVSAIWILVCNTKLSVICTLNNPYTLTFAAVCWTFSFLALNNPYCTYVCSMLSHRHSTFTLIFNLLYYIFVCFILFIPGCSICTIRNINRPNTSTVTSSLFGKQTK
jgi:hypothetical protein